MCVGILGGAVAQVPIGRWSDRTDRRLVIGAIMLTGAIVALLGTLFAAESTLIFYVAIFLIGATTMPIYALCIAHASDNAAIPLVEVTSSVLIVHSVGSIIGPIIVAVLMDKLGASSFFSYVLVCLMVASIWTFHRLFAVDRTHEHAPTLILPRTTQVVATMSSPAASQGDPGRGDDYL
jgi:MFS family permease